jgi:uncharacterized protein (UPF0147 family)
VLRNHLARVRTAEQTTGLTAEQLQEAIATALLTPISDDGCRPKEVRRATAELAAP